MMRFLIPFFGLTALLVSCAFLSDMTRMDPVQVTSFLPDRTFLSPEEVGDIRLTFSASMNRALTEESFTVTKHSSLLAGTFRWEKGNRTLVFLPYVPWEARKTYTVTLSTGAEDQNGNSLEQEFSHTFHTRPETDSPLVVSVSPAPGSKISHPREPIWIQFSEAMDPADTLASFSLSPSLPGVFNWNTLEDTLQFTPLEDYRRGETYRVTLGKSAADREGNFLPEEYSFQFSVPITDVEVVSVTSRSGNRLLSPVSPGTFLDPSLEIEKDELFLIQLSSPLKPGERSSIVTLRPSIPYRIQWEEDRTSFVLTFSDPLRWGTVYEMEILQSTYRFLVNGPGSIPLRVCRIIYIQDTEENPPVREELLFARNYEFPTSSHGAFDVYISHGIGSSIELASFLSAVSIVSGNGCLDIHLQRVEESPANPAPDPPPSEGDPLTQESVFRVYCTITSLFESGTVTICLDSDMKDNRKNHLEEKYTLVVNKQ
jgi:hypothetical protein